MARTTTKPSTTRKTTTAKTAAAKSKVATTRAQSTAATASVAAVVPASAATPEPTVIGEMKPVVTVREMKKKEFMDAVVARSGTRKKLAKPVVEAALAILGETLADGVELNMPPLGKMKINRAKKIRGGQIVMCKLRVSDAAPKAAGEGAEKAVDEDNEGLADTEE